MIAPSEVKTEENMVTSALVTFFLDPTQKPQGLEGFVRMKDYSVNPRVEPMVWVRGGKRTLTTEHGGRTDGGHCILGITALSKDLKLTSVVSFYRAPGPGNGPESPFDGPNPRRNDIGLTCDGVPIGKGGPNFEDVYLYPILGPIAADGSWPEEAFKNKGNYYYTVCVRLDGKDDYICDPEMQIQP